MRKRDYSRSIAPNFDAVEDIKDWLGERGWRDLQKELRHTHVLEFYFICKRNDLTPWQTHALYDMVHGEGAYKRDTAMTELTPAIQLIADDAERGSKA